MYGELMSNEQGGREFEEYYAEHMARARKLWMEETGGLIAFDDWLDGATLQDLEEEK